MPATVKVWDPFVRLFHWSLVALFAAACATGDESDRLHIAICYAIARLIALRIMWGFAGSSNARFSDFVHALVSSFPISATLFLESAPLPGRQSRRRSHDHRPACDADWHKRQRLSAHDGRVVGIKASCRLGGKEPSKARSHALRPALWLAEREQWVQKPASARAHQP